MRGLAIPAAVVLAVAAVVAAGVLSSRWDSGTDGSDTGRARPAERNGVGAARSRPSERPRPQTPRAGRGALRRAPAGRRPAPPAVRYRDSRALGVPAAGSLVRGTQLPARGAHFSTWDPILRRSPGRGWRRFATDELVRIVLRVARRYAARAPGALPMLVGDLSRPRGGDFGPQYGFVGHSTHQNGLDVDVYYPRVDQRRKPPKTPAQVARPLAQRLVDLFVAAGAETVLVGPNVGLTGAPGIVKPYPNHDNHLHVRIRNPAGGPLTSE